MTHQESTAAIEARERASTPGPWTPANEMDGIRGITLITTRVDSRLCIVGSTKVQARLELQGDIVQQARDAVFIAGSRIDIPYLLDRIRRAEELLRMWFLKQGATRDLNMATKEFLDGEAEEG